MRPHLQHTFRLTLRPDGTHLLRLVDVVRYWDLAATPPPVQFVADSPLEVTGFEPSVPRGKCPTLRVSAVLSAGIRSPCKSQRSGP